MTSRNSFFKMLIENGRRRKTEWILSVIVFLAVMVLIPVQSVASSLYVGWLDGGGSEYIAETVKAIFSTANPMLHCVTIVASWICGFNSMSYLFSKPKTDLYHSIPVSRKKLFLVSYTNSIFAYAVPYLITLCIGLTLVFVLSNGTIVIWGQAFLAFGYHLLGYWMLLNINLLIVMLSGKLLVAALGMVATYGYGIFWYVLLEQYKSIFLYCLGEENYSSAVQILSPVCNYLISGSLADYIGLQSLEWLMALIAVICLAATFLLYLKRPSSASGGTIAFAGIKPVIKGGVMLPLALLGGVIMYATYHSITFWLFGAIFVIVVSHIVLQGILEQADIRAIGKGLKTVGVVTVLAVIFGSVYYFDIFGYNGYMPEQEDVESCGVLINNDQSWSEYYTFLESQKDSDEKRAGRMKITDIEEIYELSEAGYETRKRLNRQGTQFDQESEDISNFTVYYHLKNGKTVERTYTIDNSVDKNAEKLKNVLDNPQYKISSWAFLASGDYDIEIYGYSKNGETKSMLISDAQEKQALTDALKVDIMENSVDTMKNQPGVGYIKFVNYTTNNGVLMGNITASEYVSISYENVAAIMEKYGFLTDNIESITLPAANKVSELYVYEDERMLPTYSENLDIASIMPYLKPDTGYYPSPLYGTMFEYHGDDVSNIKVELYMGDGSYYAVLDSDAPEWVLNELDMDTEE